MGKPVIFYLIRHGQTYTNLRELLIGGGGSAPLTPIGRSEAKLLGFALQDVPFDAAYASPLARALETGRCILGDRPLELHKAEGLRDISWGDLEGRRPEALAAVLGRKPHSLHEPFGDPDDAAFVPAFGGENMYAFLKRFGAEIDRIGYRHSDAGGRVLAICHSSLVFFLRQYMEDAPENVGNTSVTELVWTDGGIRVVRVGDLSLIEKGQKLATNLPPLSITLFGDAETLFRSKGLLEGRCDSVLTEKGLRQADVLAEKWRDTGFVAAYRSPLDRACALAKAVVPADMTVNVCEGLEEMFFAEWECESIDRLRETHPAATEALWRGGKPLLALQTAGEHAAAAAARILRELRIIARNHEQTGGHIAVFSHDMAIRAALAALTIETPPESDIGIFETSLTYQNEVFRIDR